MICLPLLLNTGCASQNGQHSTKDSAKPSKQHIIELNSSEVAQYWVTKDKLIDWQQLLPTAIDIDKQSAVYKVSFVINTDGQMSQVSMKNTANNHKVTTEQLRGVNDYQFYATTQNITRQAVRVNATVKL